MTSGYFRVRLIFFLLNKNFPTRSVGTSGLYYLVFTQISRSEQEKEQEESRYKSLWEELLLFKEIYKLFNQKCHLTGYVVHITYIFVAVYV